MLTAYVPLRSDHPIIPLDAAFLVVLFCIAGSSIFYAVTCRSVIGHFEVIRQNRSHKTKLCATSREIHAWPVNLIGE